MTNEITKAAEAAAPDIEEGKAIEVACSDVVLETHADLKNAVGVIAEVKTRYREVDAKRRSLIDPLHEVVEKINTEFAPALDAYADAEKILKVKVADYTTAKHAEADALIGEVKNQQERGDRVTLIERAEAMRPPKVDGLAVRELIGGKVVDKEALIRWAVEQERFDLLKVDEKLLKAATKAAAGDPGIPGWAPEVKRSVAITAGKVRG